MKANVPEKIYIFEFELQREDHVVRYGVNQDKGIEGLIEYTRTDAFIEKAAKWLEDNAIEYWGTEAVDNGMMIVEFKKAMRL